MKIIYKGTALPLAKKPARMSLQAFAEANLLELEIKERSAYTSTSVKERFYASFRDVSIRDQSTLVSEYGNGSTPERAIAEYAKVLDNKNLVKHGNTSAERSLGNPRFLPFVLDQELPEIEKPKRERKKIQKENKCERAKITVDELLNNQKYRGIDNFGSSKSKYLQKVIDTPEADLPKLCYDAIWRSAYANNNPRSDFHWQVDAVSDILEARGLSRIYTEAHKKCVHDTCG